MGYDWVSSILMICRRSSSSSSSSSSIASTNHIIHSKRLVGAGSVRLFSSSSSPPANSRPPPPPPVNPPDPTNPDAATLREQWSYALRQYSKWYSHAWGTAILAGVSLFALGWVIKGENPITAVSSRDDTAPQQNKSENN